MSLATHKKIKLRNQNTKEAEAIKSKFNLSPVASRVIAARGYKADDELKTFLSPTLKEGLPHPEQLKNLDAACDLIAETVELGGKIAICCDFDVDGLTGGSQVLHFFQSIGVETEIFVPDRFLDGYGLNSEMVKEAVEKGCSLLITIDFGTTNQNELELAQSLGLNTIVIDHHHVGAHEPPATVFINPNQQGCGFAGKILAAAGLAWYLVAALCRKLPQAKGIDPKSYLDIACLGTICDMVPLVGANRVIAKRGLELLTTSKRPGMIAMKNLMNVNEAMSCYHVSFGIGPRINAAGRMAHGKIVTELLTTSDSKRAEKIAAKLERLNKGRQETESKIKERAQKIVERKGELPAGILVWDESYHTGVIGIVAQRLVEAYYRPSAVMGMDEQGIYKGSARGIIGFNVVQALTNVGEHLLKFGGHEGAGGFAVAEEKLEAFVEAYTAECERQLASLETDPYATADTEVNLKELELSVVEELKTFEPFGMGNASPQLMLKAAEVKEITVLKNAHIKAQLTDGKNYINAFLWRETEHPALSVGAKVNVVFKPDINSFNGYTSLQANIQAVEAA